MSKNISNLSGRIGLKDNLFKKISENTLNHNSQNSQEIAKQYNMGVSTIHGAESFYEFLRPSHREKKAFVCNGSACMCSGTQEPLKKKLQEKLGEDKVGEMFCLGQGKTFLQLCLLLIFLEVSFLMVLVYLSTYKHFHYKQMLFFLYVKVLKIHKNFLLHELLIHPCYIVLQFPDYFVSYDLKYFLKFF